MFLRSDQQGICLADTIGHSRKVVIIGINNRSKGDTDKCTDDLEVLLPAIDF